MQVKTFKEDKEIVQQGSESYEGNQALEAKNETKLHYLNQSKYMPTRNESRAAK